MKLKRKRKITKKTKIILGITIPIFLFLLILYILPLTAVAIIYKTYIDKRYYLPTFLSYENTEFEKEGLIRKSYNYKSNLRQEINCYIYKDKDINIKDYKGIVIYSHSFLVGGHEAYLSAFSYLTKNNFLCFGYDATGNGKSTKKSMRGFEQGVIDLDYLIKKIKKDNEYNKYPIFLVGHSWGGYVSGAILQKHPDIKGTVLIGGFDSVYKIFDSMVRVNFPKFLPIYHFFEPLIKNYIFFKFGKNANLKASDGLIKTNGSIFIISSENDTVVRNEVGSDYFRKKLKNKKNVFYKDYLKRHHEFLETDETFERKVQNHLNIYMKSFLDNFVYEQKIDNQIFSKLTDKKAIRNKASKLVYKDIINFLNDSLSR